MENEVKLIEVDDSGKIVDSTICRNIPLMINSDEILPYGLIKGAAAFVVDKIDVVFCDGNNRWYREAGKYVSAGLPVATLFSGDTIIDDGNNVDFLLATKSEVTF